MERKTKSRDVLFWFRTAAGSVAVTVGDHNLRATESSQELHTVSQIFVHERYGGVGGIDNDIGKTLLLKLRFSKVFSI